MTTYRPCITGARHMVSAGHYSAAHAAFRRSVRHLDRDRVLSGDIATARELLDTETLRAAAERAVGSLV